LILKGLRYHYVYLEDKIILCGLTLYFCIWYYFSSFGPLWYSTWDSTSKDPFVKFILPSYPTHNTTLEDYSLIAFLL